MSGTFFAGEFEKKGNDLDFAKVCICHLTTLATCDVGFWEDRKKN